MRFLVPFPSDHLCSFMFNPCSLTHLSIRRKLEVTAVSLWISNVAFFILTHTDSKFRFLHFRVSPPLPSCLDRFFSCEQAKSECDWLVMSAVFVASQSSCPFLNRNKYTLNHTQNIDKTNCCNFIHLIISQMN